MAFKAKTILGRPNQPNAYAGFGQPREIAGVSLTGRLKTYAGQPPAEMLEDDCVDVQTLEGRPWPRSSTDRNSKSAHRMRIAEEDGRWPTEREKALQEFVEAKLADPDHVGRTLLKEQGMRDDEVEKWMARQRASTRNIPVIPAKKRGPGRPPKADKD